MSSRALICIDVRREHAPLAQPGWLEALANAGRILAHARINAWRIVHAFTRTAGFDGTAGSIAGFEPSRDEEVYALKGVCLFEEMTLSSRDAFIVGAAYSRAGLASVLAAQTQDLPITLVPDAIWTSRSAPAPAEQILSFARSTRGQPIGMRQTQFVVGGACDNIIDLGGWR